MYYQVKITNSGGDYFLRRTTWSFAAERGDVFGSPAEAQAALAKAKQFTRPAMFKLARCVEAEDPDAAARYHLLQGQPLKKEGQ